MRNIILIIVLLMASHAGISQTAVGIDKIIDSVFASTFHKASPGVAITIIQDKKIIAKKTYGLANLEHNIAFTHNTPVRLGYSGAREFMCAGLAVMVSEGLLRFDDKVKSFFPDMPVWSTGVTIQDLLNHRSGFDDEWGTLLLMQASMDNRVDKEQFLKLLYNQPLPQVQPGLGYMYSNSDFALLRLIMEKVSRKKCPDYLQEKLFRPLGMSATFMNDELERIIPALADNYQGVENYFKQVGVKTSPGGNYRMVTTASDLEKWGLAVSDSTSFVAKAFQLLYNQSIPIPVLSPERHFTFGHEWIRSGNTELVKHGGVNRDFYMTRIPSQNIIIIGLGNSINNMAAAMKLAGIFMVTQPVSKKEAPPVPSEKPGNKKVQIGKFAGRYLQQSVPGHSSSFPSIVFYDIKMHGDSLHFYYNSNDFFIMSPIGDSLFKDADYGAIIQFRKSHPDSAIEMKIWPPDGSGIMHFKKSWSVFNPGKSYLEEFTGEYHSKHLDFYCRIVLSEGNHLIIRRPTISDKLLIPDGENRFLFEMETGGGSGFYVLATFTRDSSGKVNGMNLRHVRMMHHRFDKVR